MAFARQTLLAKKISDLLPIALGAKRVRNPKWRGPYGGLGGIRAPTANLHQEAAVAVALVALKCFERTAHDMPPILGKSGSPRFAVGNNSGSSSFNWITMTV